WLKRDWLVLLLYLIATIVMTYPVAFRLGGEWVASRDVDTYVKLWDQWRFGQTIHLGLPLNFTRDIFFPTGIDLTFHSTAWTVVTLAWLLSPIFGPIGAYNFTILIAVFTTAYGGYLLIRSMVDHRSAAWLGGAVYSFIPYHIAHTGGHPDLVHLAGIPIAALLFIRALTTSSIRSALGTALMLGFVALTSLYIMDFALITLVPLFIFLAFQQQRWRQRDFWKVTILFSVATAIALSVRLFPLFQSGNALSAAIEDKYEAATLQTDLLSFGVPSPFNPFFAPYVERIANQFPMNHKWPSYLGLVASVMGLSALTWKKRRGLTWMWAATGIIFGVMALGTVLRFNGTVYDNITLPLAYLEWLPPIRAIGRPDYFVLGLALPLAVGAGLGFDRWLVAVGDRRRAKTLLIIGTTCFMLFEYWNGIYPGFTSTPNPFYTQIANEPDEFGLIDLPMGRFNSKEYMYDQITHQRPIVEGLIGRTPLEAFTYIDNNPLLERWHTGTPLDCQETDAATIKHSLDQLATDNFRYIIVHQTDGTVPDTFSGYLTSQPVYHDDSITAYSIADLQTYPPCTSTP
ncbi:MAG TPA: hypothetical protein VFF70_09145, partial [Anaerolineae bacterium]|nr:hypothetical protein [Anaerolineae bacterium]